MDVVELEDTFTICHRVSYNIHIPGILAISFQWTPYSRNVLIAQKYVSVLRPSHYVKLRVNQYHLMCLRKQESHWHAHRNICASQKHDHRGLHSVVTSKTNPLSGSKFLLCSENVPIPRTSQQGRIGDCIYSLLYMHISKSMRAIGTCSWSVGEVIKQHLHALEVLVSRLTPHVCMFNVQLHGFEAKHFEIGQTIIISYIKDPEIAWIDPFKILTALDFFWTVKEYYYNFFFGGHLGVIRLCISDMPVHACAYHITMATQKKKCSNILLLCSKIRVQWRSWKDQSRQSLDPWY